MTEITDLSPTDSSNTSVSGESLDGAIANMGRMDNTLQAILGMFGRWTSSDTVASASTTDIGAQAEAYLTISGTTAITSFGTIRAGTIRFLKFSGILTLTYNATSLKLPSAANITTAVGDTAVFVSEGSGNWQCLSYERANGQPLTSSATVNDTLSNKIVNGDMRDSLENGNTSGTTNGYFGADQWATYRVTSAGVITTQRVQSVTPAGALDRYRVTITTQDASLAAGEYLTITQPLEGSNVRDFLYGSASAKAAVLRFGFKGPAGTYAVALHNSAANRSYVALFTITGGQANTDTVQTISITGDTTGTWLTADGVIGITLDIVLACGSTFQGVAGWQAGNILGTSGVSNGMGTAAAVFELFDVGLKLDPNATGVYGVYNLGEIDPVYRSERYIVSVADYNLGFTLNSAALVNGNFSPRIKPAKAMTLLSGSYSAAAGANGTLGLRASAAGNGNGADSVLFYNPSNNWSATDSIKLVTAVLSARLS